MIGKNFTRFIAFLIIGLGLTCSGLFAQDLTPWTIDPYGNSWIDYSKKYLRLTVPKNGMYKIAISSLPAGFNVSANLQLWHRGKEIPIAISGDNEIIFYGEKNDGAGEGLLYRPGPEARLNPYVNIFSELGYYFLTNVTPNPDTNTPKRISVVDGGAVTGTPEPYHFQKDIVTFNNLFSFTTYGPNEELNPSFYESGNSWTSGYIYGPGTGKNPQFKDVDIHLKNWVKLESARPRLDVLVNGLNPGVHQINFYIGNSAENRGANKIIDIPAFSKFTGQKASADLVYPTHLSESGDGFIRVSSSSNDLNDYFGLSYYTVTYPQLIDMGGPTPVNAAFFNFNAAGSSPSFVSIANAPANAVLYDITNPAEPKLIQSARNGANLEAMVPRVSGTALNLYALAPTEITAIPVENISNVTLAPLYANNDGDVSIPAVVNPSSYDYLIITHDIDKNTGLTYPEYVTASVNYAKYRSSVEGGKYKTLVVNIRDIYDQFNFGEPSPIAIKRFVKYMLRDGIRPKHNLLLIGHSITYSGFLKKEMKGEVPTFGDPASDILLTAGLQPVPNEDVPAIPVGRINAYTSTEIDNYRKKVEVYESEVDVAWRRNIIQLVGGHGQGQVTEFKGYFNYVNNNYVDRNVDRNVYPIKDNAGSTNPVDIDNETIGWINAGAGMISYFGHGNQVQTTLFVQELTKTTTPVFEKNSKFPVMYFLGCGVGNNSFTPTKQYFAANWLMADPERGAIAVLSNTALTWIPQAYDHMKKFYEEVFTARDTERPTIGQVVRDIALRTIPTSPAGRTMAADPTTTSMIHQMTLMGDPAIVVLKSNDGSLPVDLFGFKAELLEREKVKLEWKTAWEKNNSHFIVERSYNAKVFEEIGYVEGKMDASEESSYSFIDKNPGAGINYYRIKPVDLVPGKGKASYSKMIAITIPDTDQFVVFPNPVVDRFEVTLNVPAKFKSWKLTDVKGKFLAKGETTSHSISKLPTGIYILEVVTHEGDVYHEKIVKK